MVKTFRMAEGPTEASEDHRQFVPWDAASSQKGQTHQRERDCRDCDKSMEHKKKAAQKGGLDLALSETSDLCKCSSCHRCRSAAGDRS